MDEDNFKTRRSVNVAGITHVSPIPAASRIKNVVMTGAIYGRDPGTQEIPRDAARQVKLMFENLASIIAMSGADVSDIIKLTISVMSLDIRPLINEEWEAMFPDASARPARHVIVYSHFTSPIVVGCEAYAVA